MAEAGAEPAQDARDGGGSSLDMQGVRRGRCEGCSACTGWVQPQFPLCGFAHPLMMACLSCGCNALDHTDEGYYERRTGYIGV